jgi:hypothetical protein
MAERLFQSSSPEGLPGDGPTQSIEMTQRLCDYSRKNLVMRHCGIARESFLKFSYENTAV